MSHCKSYRCKECKHYVKFLKCSTMHTICWNKENRFFEKAEGKNITFKKL